MRKTRFGRVLPALLLLAAGVSRADDRVVLETTEVTGNDELPKVLYVLPWREVRGEPPAAQMPPAIDAAFLTPLDPVTHERQIRTYRALVGQPHDRENER